MRLLSAVAVGGALGSAARYLIQGWVQERAARAHGWIALFPFGTLAVNLVGCFAIGALATLFQERLMVAPELRSFLLLGVLGGFTTFSAFGFETVALARDGNFALVAANVSASVVLGLVGVWLGVALVRLIG
jgi:CrcB protein